MTAVIYARYSSDNQRGGLMTFNTIQHMLNNRRYIGELKYRDVLIPDAIPSIVSAELFNDVQEKMLKNKKAPARRKAEDDYLLTTKLDMSLKDQRQALVDTFINAIYLYDDKVLITFNYKEGTQTVTFGEAVEVASEGNGSDLDCFTAPNHENPNLFSIGEGFGFFVFFGNENNGSSLMAVCPKPYQKKRVTKVTTVKVP